MLQYWDINFISLATMEKNYTKDAWQLWYEYIIVNLK